MLFSVQTVCSMNRPFKISIKTDDIEYAFPAAAAEGLLANARGFGLGRLAFSILASHWIELEEKQCN